VRAAVVPEVRADPSCSVRVVVPAPMAPDGRGVGTVTLRVLPTERPQIQFEEGGELGGPPEDEPAPEPEEPSEEEREEDVPGAVSFAVGMGPYVGQVGAFAEWTNALRQAEQVRAAGYTVGVVPRTTDEGLLYRVWAGDYRSPAAALDRLEDRLPAARPDEQFTVQVGAFSDWGRAQQRAAAMRRRLDYVAIQPRKWADETLYRVWVGGFEDRAAAEQQRALLEEDVPLAYVVEAKTKGKYAVQIGAFAEAERARQQVSEIRQTGEPAYVQFTSGAEDAPYKALVGSIP
jgi:cell division septation protein DedD